jgi:hypothetical protein
MDEDDGEDDGVRLGFMVRLTSSLWLALASCGGGGGFPDAPGIDASPTGTFSSTWSVIDTANQPLACERIAGLTMTVLAHNKAFEGGSTQIFSCATGMGTSQAMIAGIYDLAFQLSGTFGLLDTAVPQDGVVIEAGANTVLSPVTFQVEATGALSFQLASGMTGGNCELGAGIDAMTITMTRNSDGACAPLALDIGAGATKPASQYTINCTTPADGPCIEADQVISATGVDSDAYTIRVRGKIATKACWVNNDSIQVPPLGKTLMRTLNLAKDTQVPGC